jgi:hypothetical protein
MTQLRVPVVVVALACVFLSRTFSPSASGLLDVDFYWHLAYGNWILDHAALPTQDLWSWTFRGTPYRLTQWGGELALALAWRIGGVAGTQALCAGLATLTMFASYRTARLFLASDLASLALAIGANALLSSLPCRPHQWTHLGLALLGGCVARCLVRGEPRVLIGLPVLFLTWVNLHGGYVLGLTLLAAVTALAALDACLARDAQRLRALCLPLALATLAALLATLANPYGIAAWRSAWVVAALRTTALGFVDEWAATSIKDEVGLHCFCLQAALFAALAMRTPAPSIGVVLGAIALAALGEWARRLAVMASIVSVPLLAHAFAGTHLYRLTFEGHARRDDANLGALPALALLLVFAAGAAAAGRLDHSTDATLAERLPVEAVRFIRAHALTGRILNPPEAGGYLLHTLGAPVFIDTRYDLYGDAFFFDYLRARRGNTGWRAWLARYDPDLLLVDNAAALRELVIGSDRYRPVFESARFTLLVPTRAHPELPTVPLRWAPAPLSP